MKDSVEWMWSAEKAWIGGYTHPWRVRSWWSGKVYYDLADAEQWPLPGTPGWGYVEWSPKSWLEENQGQL